MFSPERQEPAVRLTAYLPIPAIRMASYRVLFRSPNDPKETPSTTGFNVRFLRIGWSTSFPIGVAEMGIQLTV